MGVGAYEVAAGYLRDVGIPGDTGTNGITYKVPGSSALRVESLAFEVTTAGGGGNRQVVVQVQNDIGAARYAIAAPGLQAGGLAVVYSFGPDIPPFGTAALGFMGGPFVRGFLPAGSQIVLALAGAAAGDAFSGVGLFGCAEPVTGGDD